MIEQKEPPVETFAPVTNERTSLPWPDYDDATRSAKSQSQCSDKSISTCSSKSTSTCGTRMYALSFIIPSATVAAIYLPDAIKCGNCAMATIPAVLAGTAAFGLYRFAKFIKHRK